MPSLLLLCLLTLAAVMTALLIQLTHAVIRWLAAGILANWLWQQLPQPLQVWIEQHLQKTLSDYNVTQWVLVQGTKLIIMALLFLLPVELWLQLSLVSLLLLPELRAWQQRRHYRRQLMRQWPATLDVIAMTLHAGLSFRATLHTLSDAATVSIAFHELARMHAQQQAGLSLEEVLNEFANRIPHATIALFRAAVLQAQKGGGALASTLEQQAQQARTMQLLAAEKNAQEAAVKLLFPLLVCFFPVTFLLILGPVILSFMQGESM